jgi:hypothetical protein
VRGWLWELHRPLMDTSRLGAQPVATAPGLGEAAQSLSRVSHAQKRGVGRVDQTANLDG